MAALYLVLAIIRGTWAMLCWEDIPRHGVEPPIRGYSDGLLLAMAAALGFALGLRVAAAASTTRARRAHRKRLGTAGRDPCRQVADWRSPTSFVSLPVRPGPSAHSGRSAAAGHGTDVLLPATTRHAVVGCQ